jgi:NDP-sugar pyrophosphorylase family protein
MLDYNLVIPMAGLGSRFRDVGYLTPKPLLPIGEFRMFETVIANLASPGLRQVSLVAPSKFNLSDECSAISDKLGIEVTLTEIDEVTSGPATTVALGLDALTLDLPVIVANSDQFLSFAISTWLGDIESRDLDGSILVMRDSDPKWSFAKVDSDGMVVKVREKKVISNLATCGVYYFKSPSDLRIAILKQFQSKDSVNGEYYVAPLYNYLALEGKSVGVLDLGPVSEVMFGLGTPIDYETFLLSETMHLALEITRRCLG